MKEKQQQKQKKIEGVSVRSSTRDTGYAAECPLIKCELRGSWNKKYRRSVSNSTLKAKDGNFEPTSKYIFNCNDS